MPRRSVALLIETSNSYSRGVLDGITEYVRHHERWSIFLPEQERGGRPPQWLGRWSGDGIIARIETDEIAASLRRTKLPVVDVSAARHLPDIPWVETDDEAIAELGVQHLLDRGFRNLAYCGDPGFNWSNWRRDKFRLLVESAGVAANVYDSLSRNDPKYSWNREKRGLAKWLKDLPRPIGIFACYDIQAQKLLEVCRELDIAVPEQIAVLGVDNDQLLCELSDPPLSSIICNTQRTGFEAAALLDRMMNGEQIDSAPVLVAPQGIQTRQSTDILAIDDPDVATALRFIREHALEGINVADVVRHVPLSRRVLESRFKKILGRSPHEELTRLKLERIKELLTETDLSLSEIARRTGFEHDEYMCVFFRKLEGMPPGQFRQPNR
ncbi:XylR family transcriptional regulator [Fuerstiella marisgermanici]|uniref:Xylose operon regulatory protein n=1 Tax=Fuerstiella marisgermanici TaxID=1891926 RepID=A0A1P8WH19_9PLAN|nr:DNA-binding transcriptional regulator [Fuerstiella marisgermanici]APZ93376.1 Xylose operon regulatory protein [Fuerstiella marisgermanici]